MSNSLYETHIVGYAPTDLKDVPKPYFVNQVVTSAAGFSQIATFEDHSLRNVWEAFECGCRWSLEQLQASHFAAHVNLEQYRDITKITSIELQPPVLEEYQAEYIAPPYSREESMWISSWDIHLDGTFAQELKEFLASCGWIILDYLSPSGHPITTLTLHFVQEAECVREFGVIVPFLRKVGGFSGKAYWEVPLAFQIFGETKSRTICFPC